MNHFILRVSPFFCLVLILFSSSAKTKSFDELMSSSATPQNEAVHFGNYFEWAEYLNRQMTKFVENRKIPNAAIALVSTDKIHLLMGYGYADMANKIPVDAEKHLFRTGSVAKIFTWTAIMQLYEKGLLDLDTDINQYLDFELKTKVAYKSKNPEPITLHHLMTHTAGFEDVLNGLFSFDPQPVLKEYLINNAPARIYPPGMVMAYCNYGTSLAGYIVEQVSGLKFEDYVQKNIFQPLGMNNSSFQQPLPAHLENHFVTPYRFVQGQYLGGFFENMPGPAGGLSTTALDMALFMMAHLNGGENETGRFLTSETLAEMYAPVKKYHPALAGMAHGLMVSEINGYQMVQHSGSSSVFDAGFYLLPGLDIGVFIVYSGGDYAGHIGVFRDFMDEFFPMHDKEAKVITPLSKPDVSKLKGEYHQSRKDITGSNRILNLLMGSLHMKINPEGQIVFNLYEHDYVYEEITPGIYRSVFKNTGYPFGAMEYILATTSPDGRIMLVTDGPMTYIKARWHETAAFAGLIFLPALLLALASIIFFLAKFIYMKWVKRISFVNKTYKNINRIIISHSILLLVLLLLFAFGNNPHPVHLLPESFFRPNPFMEFLLTLLTIIIAVLGLLAGWSAFQTWQKRMPGRRARIYYTVYGVWAVGLVWLFWFYNMLSF
jgi:CubicO group peptidase (beta-lactamase class C family)